MSEFDWEPFEGNRWRPENVGDELVGKVTALRVEKGRNGDIPVLNLLDNDGKDREVWASTHLQQRLAELTPQVGDMVAMKLTELKPTGQASPMKMFAVRVKKAEANGEQATPVEPTDPSQFSDEVF